MNTMKERPILMSGPMVRAILEGRKTQTRRIMKPQPHPEFLKRGVVSVVPQWPMQNGVRWFMADGCSELVPCPYGQPGDRLWVKETWQYAGWTEDGYPYVRYAVDGTTRLVDRGISDEWAIKLEDTWQKLSTDENYAIDKKAADRKWRPSIFMPRWASRITLEVTAVRVERLQDISCEDALAEGIDHYCPGVTAALRGETEADPVAEYRTLWESINGPGSWDANPWVWVISFRRINP